MLRRVRVAVAAAVLAALLWVGARPVGPAPALGPLLEPAHGAWAMARVPEHARDDAARVPGMRAEVDVRYDDRGVPHVFATNLDDAWRAMGYVVARDRLFQLELQTLATEGRLTEIAGPRALPLDREMRLLGLAASARAKYAALPGGSTSRRAVDRFADGVNAWIDAMPEAALPIEYRLLGRRPSRWEPWHSVLLLNRMGWTLAYNEAEVARERAAALVGRRAADALYPRDAPLQEPIEPAPGAYPRFTPPVLPPPGALDTSELATAAATPWRGPPARRDGSDALGSNSWAVAPSRSATGNAILAGDPHLELSLPSVWYEMHLVVPDTLDVYGATIPGAPMVIIGFNRDAAWTYTNVESDVLDRYVETVDEPARPTRYRLDGEWRRLRLRVEEYRDAGGRAVHADTIRHTHRGPMERLDDGRWVSLRWTVLESGDDLQPFLDVARSRSVADYLAAMRTYQAPAQNMLVADRAGAIAIRSTGRFPVRPRGTTGMALQDGSRSAVDWRGDVDVARYPHAVNPAQGYLASANQQPRDPAVDTTYLGADWYAPWRAVHINRLLRERPRVGTDDMRRFQTDPGSARADAFAPLLLAAGGRALAAGAGSRADGAALREAVALLGEWSRRYTKDDRRAVLFEYAMTELQRRAWDELRPPGAANGNGAGAPLPKDMLLLGLLSDSANVWWNDAGTAARESRDDIVAASLVAALARAKELHGDPAGDGWRWSGIRQANIHHLLRIPAFSALRIPVQGGPSTLAPSSGSGIAGASWRMVVELGAEPAAWTIYPGGQSGNPASARYRDRVAAWSDGTLERAIVPRRATDLPAARTAARLRFAPAR